MELCANDVSKELRRHLFPYLHTNGFTDSTGRKFWRHRGGKVDHIEILSTTPYYAKLDKCTTASFRVRIGVSLPVYGVHNDPFHKDYIKMGPAGPRPSEAAMPIRGCVYPPGTPPTYIFHQGLWLVNSKKDAEKSAIDLRQQFEAFALDWLNRDWDLHRIAELLKLQNTELHLATEADGSYIELNAERRDCPIRRAHVEMVNLALAAKG